MRLNATIREPGRSRVGVRVIDMSTHGCRIESTSGTSPDTWVLLSIAGLETQYCRVAWACHEFAGLEFATPLSEFLARMNGQFEMDIRPERSFTVSRDTLPKKPTMIVLDGV